MMSYLYVFTRDVTQTAFEGCIKDVQLGSATRDINNDNVEARGVLPGCPEVSNRYPRFVDVATAIASQSHTVIVMCV